MGSSCGRGLAWLLLLLLQAISLAIVLLGPATYAKGANAFQAQQPGVQIAANPYLSKQSPYKDTNGDGKLTAEELREQWEGWAVKVMRALKEQRWGTVIKLSYKLLHDPGPTETKIRYNLAFALNAKQQYAKAKGELQASTRAARKDGDDENAERSEQFLESINALKPFIEPEYAYESPLTLNERKDAAALLQNPPPQPPKDPIVPNAVVVERKDGETKPAGAGHRALNLVGDTAVLWGCAGVAICGFIWLKRRRESTGTKHRGATSSHAKNTKTKRI